jgi:hypothetical protein
LFLLPLSRHQQHKCKQLSNENLARQFIWNGVTVSQARSATAERRNGSPTVHHSENARSLAFLILLLHRFIFSFPFVFAPFLFVLFSFWFGSGFYFLLFFWFKFALVMMAIKCVHTHARCWQCSGSSARMLAGFDWLPPIIKKIKTRYQRQTPKRIEYA